ncbi:MAG TPA: helix-turn-helix domain-containing protein [Candidatus Limnocylindrales bacterium]|nr:helix-turn-helix domain-containing protein [Candidatus Limnocylindrales bacterium]
MLARLAGRTPEIARGVAADLGQADPGPLEETVRAFLAAVGRGARLAPAELDRLRDEGAAAARSAEPLARPLDRYLTTAWVAWGLATELARPGEVAALASLGGALLRAGDDVAAALSEGYSTAERALAARAGATRRAVLDELLTLVAGEPGAARVMRRAGQLGLAQEGAYRLLLVRAAGEIEDEGAVAHEVSRVLARSPARQAHLVAMRGGDLVLLLADPWRAPASLEEVVARLAPLGDWWAVRSEPTRLSALAAVHGDALVALRAARALGLTRRLVDVDSLVVERALLADAELLAGSVARWLAPLASAARGGMALVTTLQAWLDEGQSVTGAARRLGTGARTVRYRLDRVERLLGRSLDGEVVARLSVALLGRRLLVTDDPVGAPEPRPAPGQRLPSRP